MSPPTSLKSEMVTRTSYTLSGTEVGTNSFIQEPDGKFISDTHLILGKMDMHSRYTGRFKDGLIVSFSGGDDVTGTGARAFHLEFADGKISVTVNKKVFSTALDSKATVFLANYHPRLSIGLQSLKAKPKDAKSKVFLFDGGAIIQVTSTPGPDKVLQTPTGMESLNTVHIQLGTVGVDYSFTRTGTVVALDVPSQKFRAVSAGYEALFVDPMKAYPELSQATFGVTKVVGEKIAMRDGVHLVDDRLMPDSGTKFPVILMRTPYGRANEALTNEGFARRGYVVISQDCRGREDSEGKWDPFIFERQDGYDTINWIAKQPWCDGNVGMIGGSYGGYVQWAAAVEQPPALKCIIPQVSPPDAMHNLPYEYGVPMLLPSLWWANLVKDKVTNLALAAQPLPHPEKLLTLPLTAMSKAVLGTDIPFLDEWYRRDGMKDWKGYDIEKDLLKANIPALQISGWWDGDGIGTKLHWEKMQGAHRANQWLLLGPWIHAFNTNDSFGEDKYGPHAILELESLYLRWFDTWLKHKQVNLKAWPKVKYFVTGENKWHDTTHFPEPGATRSTYFLSGQGDGQLQAQPGSGVSKYTYDPKKVAVPKSLSGNLMEAQSVVIPNEKFGLQDLRFKTEPFSKNITLEGPIDLNLYFQTDTVDTDFFALIVDVHPDGKMYLLGMPGKIRASYLSGLDKPKYLTPGKTYLAHIRPWNTAHQFEKGHRLGLLVASQLFPGTARNLNTNEPIATGTKIEVAHISILHDKNHPSNLTLFKLP